jgi:hypothetical protein
MGKETQFSRAEVAPVIAEIFAATYADLEKNRPNFRLPQFDLTY